MPVIKLVWKKNLEFTTAILINIRTDFKDFPFLSACKIIINMKVILRYLVHKNVRFLIALQNNRKNLIEIRP